MALNAKTGSVTLNIKLGSTDGSEHRNWECDNDGSENQNWKYDEDGSERLYWEVLALNAELKAWHGDSECRKSWMNGGPERRMDSKRRVKM